MAPKIPIKQWNFAQKICNSCNELYTPISGASRYCMQCRNTCILCKLNPRTAGKHCDECRSVNLKEFHKTRRITLPHCLDCSVQITRGRKRCVKCSARARVRDPRFKPTWSRWRHEFNGVIYKSKWEVKFAKLLINRHIPFIYEKQDPITLKWPDFYFPALDRYIELHAPCWGKKILPDNAVLIDSDKHLYALALSLEFKHFRRITL